MGTPGLPVPPLGPFVPGPRRASGSGPPIRSEAFWPADAIGAAATFAKRFDPLVVHQLGQIAPGCGAAHLGEADGLAQGHPACETLRFGIQQPIEQLLLAAEERT